ncbi:MAG: hypothetical protein HYU67_09130 [Flavobacteriia bacterium]|nr:hypothetical protein [Flavobacteriia bacterium]
MKTKMMQFGILTLLLVAPYFLLAQAKKDKVKSMKIAYITDELSLSPTESEKFWPIYNEMEEKMKNIRKEIKNSIEEMHTKAEDMKEEEFKKHINSILNAEIQEGDIKKEYLNKIASSIGFKKTAKLMKIEKEFKAKLINEMHDKPPHPSHPPKHR